jgi:leucyl-tRNA synthetase
MFGHGAPKRVKNFPGCTYCQPQVASIGLTERAAKEKGLAYKKRSTVNYCGKCETVLANEQVEGGLCWRCGTEVNEKTLDQWFFKITAYIEELLDYCDKLPGWPEKVLTMQKNWIGKSYGCEVDFPLIGSGGSKKIL